ncbi:SMP-30/gluconolactonase/LRE family protein [Streptomyces rimosus]|uniref:SMP-30/gluconolactonase/LRE family protein n=1 Tax=Streptomyces rimosus TaxID=1927 RepID=UPI0004C28C08|nr:SMP-30/gluconolactonase/LRE family protein [Streptomyces rimosus]
MCTVSVEVALAVRAHFAECPTWDAADGTLLWVDMNNGGIHRYHPADGADTVTEIGQPVAAALPRADGGLVLSLRDGVAVTGQDGTRRWLTEWPEQGVRGNDASIDGRGRLWVGTIAGETAPGWLARVDADGTRHTAATGVRLSNGITWSPDATRMYYVDTPTRRIDVFDYDLDTGKAANRRVFAEITGTDGVPDGMCADTDGGVWVALFRGGAVRRYAPDGRLDREITFPASLTTACGFGGPGLTDLYVTSARRDLGDAEPEAGNLFVVPGVGQGLPGVAFAG